MAAEEPQTTVASTEVVSPLEIRKPNPSGGIASIKAEFLRPAPPVEPSDDQSSAATAESGANKTKTRFKKRPRDEELPLADRMCSNFVCGNGCDFSSEQCRFCHDLPAFLLQREPDLGERCPAYDLFGWCRQGALCRFGTSHIDPVTGANLKRPQDQGGVVAEPEPVNVLSKEVQAQLRKSKYPFETEKAGWKAKEKKANQQKSKDKKGAAADAAASPAVSASPAAVAAAAVAAAPAAAVDAPTTQAAESSSLSSLTSPAAAAALAAAEAPVDTASVKLEPFPSRPVKLVDFSNKIYIAPLTTVGNLPFRRIMKSMGADITCGEMAMCANLLSGQSSEWALLRRHPSEDCFGVQITAAHADQFERCAELLETHTTVDFVDVNMGCPIDLVVDKGAGSALMNRPPKIKGMVAGLTKRLTCPITLKMRIGWNENKPNAHHVINLVEGMGPQHTERISAFMIHGRSRLQRYSRLANWEYINSVAAGTAAAEVKPPSKPIIGNGDIFSYQEWEEHKAKLGSVSSCCMLARGALIKPWLPTEIKESRHWDISSTERLGLLKTFVHHGLEHWGSDQKGVNNVRRFLLEWLSFLHRYVPVGLLDVLPPYLNDRPPGASFAFGRDKLETLMASRDSKDWVKISELLLGPVPSSFKFLPKHQSNAYSGPGSTAAAASSSSSADGSEAGVAEANPEG